MANIGDGILVFFSFQSTTKIFLILSKIKVFKPLNGSNNFILNDCSKTKNLRVQQHQKEGKSLNFCKNTLKRDILLCKHCTT